MASTDPQNEKLQKEHDQAVQDISKILDKSRPKNLPQGLTAGVSSIVSGAVGAAGVAVLAPTVGLVQGAKSGGILGGVIGVTGGAVVGVVGAVGMAVGGAVSGTTQIVRGVIATPQAMIAPRRGKWWNEIENKWVYTALATDAVATLQGVPNDDSDLLGKYQQGADESASAAPSKGAVVETYYYDVLEVSPGAEQSAIKRRYYTLARKYHPDKRGADDKEATDKFQAIGEAYQVLSDPALRAKYDAVGRDGLSADKTSVVDGVPQLDPSILYAFLFGSDQFADYIGRLATATSAEVGDSNDVPPQVARQVQVRRVTRLAVALAARLEQWTTTNDNDKCKDVWSEEAKDLANASYGIQLVHLIGRVYDLTATQFMGTFDSGIGMPSIGRWAKNHYARVQAGADKNKTKTDSIMAGVRLMSLQEDLKAQMASVTTAEEKARIAKEMEDNVATMLLKVLWTATSVDITSTLYETVQMVLYDQSVSKEIRRKRAEGLQALGQVFMDCSAPEREEDKSAQKVYEEAAFAAMLETIKRKEEAATSASNRAL